MGATVRGITLGRYSDSVDAKDDEVTLLDNKKIYLGTGNDLQLSHDGSNSIINDNGTGTLKLQSGGSDKLEVLSTGVKITGDVQATSLNDGSISGDRNFLLNGECLIAQRGTQFTAQSAAAYHLDRWKTHAFNVDSGRYQVDQIADAPDGFKKSLKYSCTTANGSQNTNEQLYVQQQIEAQNINWLKYFHASPDTVTLSFHVKSNNTGTFGAALKLTDNNSAENSGDTRNYEFQYTISSADTWEKKTISITLDSDTSQAKSTGANVGMAVQFWLSAGTNRDGVTSLLTWGGNGNATSGVDNKTFFSSTANNFFITGIQLEVGPVGTSYHHKTYEEELAKCYRYYYRLELDDPYAYLTNIGVNSATISYGGVIFPVKLRAVNATFTHHSTYSDWQLYESGTARTPSDIGSGSRTGKQSSELRIDSTSMTAGSGGWVRANNNTNCWVAWDAEI